MSQSTEWELSRDVAVQVSSFLDNLAGLWAGVAWHAKHGGFVESLDLKGKPNLDEPMRIRVQARQIFFCAEVIRRNLPCREVYQKMLSDGIRYLGKLGDGELGWPHIVKSEYVVDPKRDLYDHAFLAFAGARAYSVTKSQDALNISESAIDFITSKLSDANDIGWLEDDAKSLPRRSNPHMHLLEAALELYSVTGSERYLNLISKIRGLFLSKFFNQENAVLSERFDRDLGALTCEQQSVFEAGHHYEWATLLKQSDAVLGTDSRSECHLLISTAETHGLNAELCLPVNASKLNAGPPNPNSRLWPQLERFRAFSSHPGADWSSDFATIWNSIKLHFLHGPNGFWTDEVDTLGRPISTTMPASMPYHFMTAFEDVIAPT